PGPVRRAGPSSPRERAAVGGGEDEDRLSFRRGFLPGAADAGHPLDLAPGTFAGLGTDGLIKALEVFGSDLGNAGLGLAPRRQQKDADQQSHRAPFSVSSIDY